MKKIIFNRLIINKVNLKLLQLMHSCLLKILAILTIVLIFMAVMPHLTQYLGVALTSKLDVVKSQTGIVGTAVGGIIKNLNK